ncbi:unnamed protein product [Leptidea sinapis]|uniref:FP protein C-terminal domain-containing protein n=1 Tax=Leptidea sinapis TaxID=189913 RepID=A0A5E4PNZ0_9NEOP|nr:unnamed protein product [Leptidea sinapis]
MSTSPSRQSRRDPVSPKPSSKARRVLPAREQVEDATTGSGKQRPTYVSENGEQWQIVRKNRKAKNKADALAEKFSTSLEHRLVKVSRPTKCASLRVMGLDDSVTTEELVAAVARGGNCSPAQVKVSPITSGFSGLGTAYITCPVVVAKTLANCSGMGLSAGQGPAAKVGRQITGEIRKELNEISAENSSLRSHISDLNSKQECMEKDILSLKESLEFLHNDHTELKKCSNESASNNLSGQVQFLQDKIDSMEQQSRQCNIELCNVPEKRGENLLSIIESVGTAIKFNIDPKSIFSIHRVPHARNEDNIRPKNIIVKLSSRVTRDNILSAFRMSKGLNTEQLGFTCSSRSIYMNEHLTLKNKCLFRESKAAARKNGCKYIWIRNATILARRSDTSPIFAIKNQNDLSKFTKSISQCSSNTTTTG